MLYVAYAFCSFVLWWFLDNTACTFFLTIFNVFLCIRWTRAARKASKSRLSTLPFSLAQDTGRGCSAAAKHLPGQECHHLANVSLNLFQLLLAHSCSFCVFLCVCGGLSLIYIHVKIRSCSGCKNRFQQRHDAFYDQRLAIWYENNMCSFRAIRYHLDDTIQLLKINKVIFKNVFIYLFIFCQK